MFGYVLPICVGFYNYLISYLLSLLRGIEIIRESEFIIGDGHILRDCREALCSLYSIGVALTTSLHPQREYQPFSLQCEALYEALKMPYQILPRQLPQKKLQVSSGSGVWIKEGKLKNSRSGMRTWIEAGLALCKHFPTL